MKEYIDALRKQITDNPPSFGDADSVLSLLYEAYSEVNRMDDERIKADFNALYQTMNGLTLQEMDWILYVRSVGIMRGRVCSGHQSWNPPGSGTHCRELILVTSPNHKRSIRWLNHS